MFLVLLVCCCLAGAFGERQKRNQVSNYHRNFQYSCPSGKVPSIIFSTHRDKYQDRQWYIHCLKDAPTTPMKYWTPLVHDADRTMNFTCPFNSIVSGMGGVWQAVAQDRRYKFECTVVNGVRTDCKWSNWLNNYDRPVNLVVEPNFFIAGFYSQVHQGHQDRAFKVNLCKIQTDD